MNPHASMYLQVHKQHARDLADTYRHAQRRWAHPDFPNQSEYHPVRPSRIAEAMRRLRRRPSPSIGTALAHQAADGRAGRIHAA
jgi:hypothetical protein